MGSIIRFLGLVSIIGGVGATIGGGGAIVDPILNTVRSFVATYELGILRDRMISEHQSVGQFPRPGDEEELRSFIHETMSVQKGARDPALDPWEFPYRFESGGSGDWYVLFSTGPNGQTDDCVEAGDEALMDDGADQGDAGPRTAPDDVCAWLQLGRTDAPYRRIE